MSEFHHLFQPIMIGPLEVPNRICYLPTNISSSHSADGGVSARDIWHHTQIAKGGTGLDIVGASTVNRKTNHCTVSDMAADDDSLIPGLARLAATIRRYGAVAAIQLVHAGRQTSMPRQGKITATDTALFTPSGPVNVGNTGDGIAKAPTLIVLSTDEVYKIVEEFSEAAWRCMRAGFDCVELHASHGYLISDFMSGFLNKRTDRWGGSFENRMRFPLAIMKSIQSKCGQDFPMIVRYNAHEGVPGGTELEEAVKMAKAFENAGAAALDITTGMYETPDLGMDCSWVEEGWYLESTETIKKAVKIPVFVGHTMRNVEFCDKAVADGKTDMVGFCRPLIADPYLPMKAKMGKVRAIRRCISCNIGCWQASITAQKELACTVNAACGNDAVASMKKAITPSRVAVVGGGPAGMEAARVATERGHTVTLFEKTAELGGAILGCCMTPVKNIKTKWYTDWIRNQLEDLKVDVRLCTSPSVADLKEFEIVVNATGARSYVPEVYGLKQRVVAFEDAIACPKVTCEFHPNNASKKNRQERMPRKLEGTKVIVWGDGYAAVDTATYLASIGKEVTVVTDRKVFGAALEGLHMEGIRHLFRQGAPASWRSKTFKYPVTEIPGCRILEIRETEVVLEDKEFNTRTVPCESIVTCWTRPNTELLNQLRETQIPVINIGDSVKPRNLHAAVREGSEVGALLEGKIALNPNGALVGELPLDLVSQLAIGR